MASCSSRFRVQGSGPVAEGLSGVGVGFRRLGCNAGALIIRIGFGGVPYYKNIVEWTPKPYSNY